MGFPELCTSPAVEAHPQSLLLHAQIQQMIPRERRPSLGAQTAQKAPGASGEEDFPLRLSSKQVTAPIPSLLYPKYRWLLWDKGRTLVGWEQPCKKGKAEVSGELMAVM